MPADSVPENSVTANNERQAEIEAVGREICAHANFIEKRQAAVECRRAVFLNYEDWCDEYNEEARVVIDALDRARDARHGTTTAEDIVAALRRTNLASMEVAAAWIEAEFAPDDTPHPTDPAPAPHKENQR